MEPALTFPADTVVHLLVAMMLARFCVSWLLSVLQSRRVAQARGAVPQAFEGVMSLQAHQRAADYTLCKESWHRWTFVRDLVAVAFWTLGGGLHGLEAWVRHSLPFEHAPFVGLVAEGALIGVGFVLFQYVSQLPFELWRTFRIEQAFGFNRTTMKVFIVDQLKGALLALVIGLPVWTLIIAFLAHRDAWAWLWAWACYAAISVVLLWAGPAYIAPLFNTFRPLDDHPVKRRIDALMTRAGYRHGGLFVMDGSARSTHGNAYFTGLGRTKRVVFYDTLLKTLEGDEVEAVLAHELGHFTLGHVRRQLIMALGASLLMFKLGDVGLRAEALYNATRVPGAGVGTRLLMLLFIGSLVGTWLTPLFAWLSRKREYEADAYACRMTDGAALGRALLKLFVDNGSTLTPHPFYTTFYASHPDGVSRLARLRPGGP